MNDGVGFIFTYVNSEDPVWWSSYYHEAVKRGIKPSKNSARYRDYGTLRYLLRGVAENMPYVTDIIMVVARPSQVPDWINRETVRIVYHNDYIPKEFLPTFTSNTILSMLYRIPDLPKYLIHSNDDMFVMGKTKFEQFFKDGLPCIKFKKTDRIKTSIWRNLCTNNMEVAARIAGAEIEDDKIVLPIHFHLPILRDDMIEVGKLAEKDIFNSVSFTRQSDNLSEYLFAVYAYYTKNYINEYDFNCKYIDFSRNPGDISKTIKKADIDLLCINDGERLDPATFAIYKKALLESFNTVFPNKCKYEK